jgi:hypothetical protein
MRADAAMQADLDDAAAFARGFEHGAAFVDGVAGGLFDEDVRAGFDGVDGLQRVPMIGRGDDDDLWLFFFEKLLVMFVKLWRVAAEIFHLVRADLEAVAVNVAEGDDFAAAGGGGFAQNIFAPPTGADQRGFIFGWFLAENVRRLREKYSGGGGFEKGAAFHFLRTSTATRSPRPLRQ